MTRFLARRVLGAIPLVLGIATLIFFVFNLAPGDPLGGLVGPRTSEETLQRLREIYGFDRPLPIRYVTWLGHFLTGDFGISIPYGRPVRDVLLEILPNTLMLAGSALFVAFVVGMLLGVIQAVRQYSLLDNVLSFGALFFYSMPSFWLALMLILIFSVYAGTVWDWPVSFPVSGMTSSEYEFLSFPERMVERIRYLTLPTLTLVLVLSAGIARYMRGSMLEVIRQDYVRTARAKGLPERTVIFRHAFRNALLPVITLLGLYLPFLLSGTVFVETIFAWPGMGRVMVSSIIARDIPMVMAGSFVFALMVVVGNLIADVLYALVDPRIRYDAR